MGVLIRLATLSLIVCGLLAIAADNPYAGTWRLDSGKSNGPAPTFVHDGILNLGPEIFTGSPGIKRAGDTHSAPGSKRPDPGSRVYQFTASPDGRTLTLTQPQIDAGYRSVFEKRQE